MIVSISGKSAAINKQDWDQKKLKNFQYACQN